MTPRLNATAATLVLALLCGAASGASDCAAGKSGVTDATGAACTDCPVGTFAEAKAETCTPCAAGKSVAAGAGKVVGDCAACAAGKSAAEGAACANCAAGKFAAAGAVCANCAGGKFSLAEATTCTDCAVGTFSKADFTACENCAGKHSDTGPYCTHNPVHAASITFTIVCRVISCVSTP